MATATDNGTQTVQLAYNNNATAREFSKWIHRLLQPGVYEGGTLSIDSGNDIEILPLVMLIRTTTKELVKINTASAATLTIAEATPYIVANFSWSETTNWYAQFEAKALGSINSNDVIIGKGVYVASTLTSFDYSEQSRGLIDISNNARVDNDLDIRNDISIGGVIEVTGDPTTGDHVGNRDYNDARYLTQPNIEVSGSQNLIRNGDFVFWPGDSSQNTAPKFWTWAFTDTGVDPTIERDGDSSVLMTSSADTTLNRLTQNIFEERLKGKKVKIVVNLKTTSSTVDIRIDDGIATYTENVPLTGTYTDFPIDFTLNAAATKLDVIIEDTTASISINVMSVKVYEGEYERPFQKNINDLISYPRKRTIVELTANYTILTTDLANTYEGDAAGGAFSIFLPPISNSLGIELVIKNVGASNNVTIDGNSTETIDGSTTVALTPGQCWYGYCSNSEWKTISVG